MLTAMGVLVIQHDFASPLGPIGERFADPLPDRSMVSAEIEQPRRADAAGEVEH